MVDDFRYTFACVCVCVMVIILNNLSLVFRFQLKWPFDMLWFRYGIHRDPVVKVNSICSKSCE